MGGEGEEGEKRGRPLDGEKETAGAIWRQVRKQTVPIDKGKAWRGEKDAKAPDSLVD